MSGLYGRTAILCALCAAVSLYLQAGCFPSNELGGVEMINALPDTRIIAEPPRLSDTDIMVEFRWLGDDPDGEVVGYLWKISSNGPDGISVQDTLSVDPASGQTINPWHYTTANDSLFLVSADSLGFPGDAEMPEEMQRFYQTHTFFIKAVDDRGAADPTPALVNFTATTIAPTIQVTKPGKLSVDYGDEQAMPPRFVIGWTGQDLDFMPRIPTQVRYLLKKVRFEGEEIHNRASFNRNKDQLITFHDPLWSDWLPYYEDASDRQEIFEITPDAPNEERSRYLFAIQARDTAGAVSFDLTFARTVHLIYIDGTKSPVLNVNEQFLGSTSTSGTNAHHTFDIASGQRLNFTWHATAASYGGEITGYRFGWDVDPNDPDDPNWELALGDTDAHHGTSAIWEEGLHTLYVECYDSADQRTLVRWSLSVVPIPQGDARRPVLLIDDVVDRASQRWPSDNFGAIFLYRDQYRDAFWLETLSGPGGVRDFVPGSDIVDTEDSLEVLSYRRAVSYDLLLWTANRAENYMYEIFSAGAASNVFWLDPYMQRIGNVFMVGSGIMRIFSTSWNWIFPIIYDSIEPRIGCLGASYNMSFGSYTNSVTGAVLAIGTTKFPYRSMGISMLDEISPPRFLGINRVCAQASDRTQQCAGTKAILLDGDFKDNYVNVGALPDTIFLEPVIDWRDNRVDTPLISDPYHFAIEDEIYDDNVSGRTSFWEPQLRDNGAPMIEPMFHIYTRYDWLLDKALANGEGSVFGASICGPEAFNPFNGRSVIDGATVGVISHKMTPNGKPNVLWGFDPHRMDHDKMTRTIRWVLGTHFGFDTH